jgi:flagellar biosynthesis/type III secretory pathway protein FliH
LRTSPDGDDVFVLGAARRPEFPSSGAVATAADVVAAAEERAAAIVADAEAQAAAVLAAAHANAASVTAAARGEGFEAGRAAAEAEVRDALGLIRTAAAEGKALRDQLAGQAAGVVARAVALGLRRLVGEYYEADPARTGAACAEAFRAAASQHVIAIRVHPGLVESLEVTLGGAARYLRPDDAVEIGGCIIDLRNGTIDASLEARLSLMEAALAAAGGEVQL